MSNYLLKMKKAQLQMMESIFVLVIFLFLIGFGFVFYFSIAKGSAADAAVEVSEQRSVEAALFISQLPEIQCSEGGTERGACVDLFKVRALNSIMNQNNSDSERFLIHYYDLFGFVEVKIRPIYPAGDFLSIDSSTPRLETPVGCEYIDLDPIESNLQMYIYCRRPDDKFRKSARTIFFPITIKDIRAGEEVYSFGQLEVRVFT